MGRRKKSGGGGGANWMDTYGDMVTLLLCFFVLLYSMSDVHKAKATDILAPKLPAPLLSSKFILFNILIKPTNVGENPKFLKEKLISFLPQRQRELASEESGE